jgi:phosphate/sulfate permease
MLSTISFSGVDASSTTTCQGKTLSLSAYGESSSTPLQLATSNSTALTTATIGITSGTPTSTTGTLIGAVTGGGTSALGFELGFSTPSATSGAVYKLTLQSSN